MNDKIFKRYIQLANVLGELFKNLLEVVVHDFKDLDQSIIHIVNGHISDRKIGDGASELGIRRLLNDEKIPDTLVNYVNKSKKGKKLKSASMAIRDDKGKMIGAFCLNFDISAFENFQDFLSFFLQHDSNPFVSQNDISGLYLSNEDEIESEISNYLLKKGWSTNSISYKNKQEIVHHLITNGYFKKRGAIGTISNQLNLTRQSIYNYLKKVSQ